MKSRIALLAGCFASARASRAATVIRMKASTTNPGVALVFLDAQELDGNFDTIIFDALPTAGTQWLNVNTVTWAAGTVAGPTLHLPQSATGPRPRRGRLRLGNPWHYQHRESDLLLRRTARAQDHNAGAHTGRPRIVPREPAASVARRRNSSRDIGRAGLVRFDVTIPLVPEPHAAHLAATALFGLAALRRRDDANLQSRLEE